ncbi:MAG: hypothetical protein CM1200mP41_02480 [Gammaproteobacteria bacterium]|nr:MAG: hypothetical protein CM1200mP41_02480 [Gammaproteobacteria bacterium]
MQDGPPQTPLVLSLIARTKKQSRFPILDPRNDCVVGPGIIDFALRRSLMSVGIGKIVDKTARAAGNQQNPWSCGSLDSPVPENQLSPIRLNKNYTRLETGLICSMETTCATDSPRILALPPMIASKTFAAGRKCKTHGGCGLNCHYRIYLTFQG